MDFEASRTAGALTPVLQQMKKLLLSGCTFKLNSRQTKFVT